ncbi:hypothetical protein T11_10739 [Trichinella zimbabwensis]|uniref:Uncharacterized protein n=1 Tax=Trichinella zimbabwensis TaxID=268475 RepID=A0A0V1GY95_9BILA|nr:hypothetical protein T11_10739 [Trichinella zimbabwensis]
MVLICLFLWLIFSRKSCQICPTNVYDQIIQYSFQSQSEYMSKAFVSNPLLCFNFYSECYLCFYTKANEDDYKRSDTITKDALNDWMSLKCEDSYPPAITATLQWVLVR